MADRHFLFVWDEHRHKVSLNRLDLPFGFCSESCKAEWAIASSFFTDFEFSEYECQVKVQTKYRHQYDHRVRLLVDPF
jgi:hypothetical protein